MTTPAEHDAASDEGERFLQAIFAQSARRKRRTLEQVWAVFRENVRGYTGETQARQKLASLLATLQQKDKITLPKGNRAWDRSAEPPLPRWIQLVVASPAPKTTDHRRLAWPPELAFIMQKTRVYALDELIAIKCFLASGGRTRRFVPLRERSVELFGDEKRLDSLRKTSLFASDRLTLELLRCYDVAPPLVWEATPPITAVHAAASGAAKAVAQRGVLVVENLHSYESFRRYNAEQGRWAAVAYGHGTEFKATVRDLPRVCARVGATSAEYFGDLDAEGLQIPSVANRLLVGIDTQLTLAPAVDLYQRLLERGHDHEQLADKDQPLDPFALGWLPQPLRARVAALLQSQRRLPQELIGLDQLLETP
jgi:hypothetical protein